MRPGAECKTNSSLVGETVTARRPSRARVPACAPRHRRLRLPVSVAAVGPRCVLSDTNASVRAPSDGGRDGDSAPPGTTKGSGPPPQPPGAPASRQAPSVASRDANRTGRATVSAAFRETARIVRADDNATGARSTATPVPRAIPSGDAKNPSQ
ncbi:Hypothetical protein CINCED_3A006221 [Cinara cedri]|uniref:Uncharacterized protein n=1 Tax=Cinara cedri TaxID=506608 RepID=A0A5E4N920_9HEMI|nr:Hypothetical protein CINCED_3A006221 [Cinara cedri]